MYGKLENGSFSPAPAVKSVMRSAEGAVEIERYSLEELAGMGYREVLTGDGSGRPGPGMRPSFSYSDLGGYILRRVNWVEVGK